MKSPISLVVFDIAGTLIEDHDEVADSFLAALRNNCIEVTEEEIKEWKGGSKREVIAHFVARQFGPCRNQALVEQTYSEFRWRLEQAYDGGITPIAGASHTLQVLRENGIKIATTTGFYRGVRDRILRAAGWSDVFDANACSDDVAHGRPDPEMIVRVMRETGISDPAMVMNVGDTPLDLRAGSNARCGRVVGVLTGRHTQERLQREPHTDLIASVAEIPKLLS